MVGGASTIGGGSSGSSSGVKRTRVVVPNFNVTSASHATTPRSIDISSRHQDASFKKSLPGQVRAPAVFRCHRVTTISDGAAEFVYQATWQWKEEGRLFISNCGSIKFPSGPCQLKIGRW
nr:isoform 3 of protein lateral root primordium 1 [Quercus suber]